MKSCTVSLNNVCAIGVKDMSAVYKRKSTMIRSEIIMSTETTFISNFEDMRNM